MPRSASPARDYFVDRVAGDELNETKRRPGSLATPERGNSVNTQESSFESELPDDLELEPDRSFAWPVFASIGTVLFFVGSIAMMDPHALVWSRGLGGPWLLTVGGLFVVGLLIPTRWTWRCCRIVGICAGVYFMSISSMDINSKTAHFSPEYNPHRYLLLYASVSLIAVGVLLELPSARRFYHSVCPRCLSRPVKAGEIIFESLRCRDCGNRW
jgi:hypothetical protein